MNCIDFRRAVGVSAQELDDEFAAHAGECSACAGFLEDMLGMDDALQAAVSVPVPPEVVERLMQRRPRRRLARPVLFALAAGMLLAVGLAAGLWLGPAGPGALSNDVLAHIHYEQHLLEGQQPTLRADDVRRVALQGHAVLDGDIGGVHHAGLCEFRGHVATHLVVAGRNGPITVLLLPDEPVPRTMPVNEEGYRGIIVPVGAGSIAIVGAPDADIERVRQRFARAVSWDI